MATQLERNAGTEARSRAHSNGNKYAANISCEQHTDAECEDAKQHNKHMMAAQGVT